MVADSPPRFVPHPAFPPNSSLPSPLTQHTPDNMPFRIFWTYLQIIEMRLAAIDLLLTINEYGNLHDFVSDWWDIWLLTYGMPVPDDWDEVPDYELFVDEYREVRSPVHYVASPLTSFCRGSSGVSTGTRFVDCAVLLAAARVLLASRSSGSPSTPTCVASVVRALTSTLASPTGTPPLSISLPPVFSSVVGALDCLLAHVGVQHHSLCI